MATGPRLAAILLAFVAACLLVGCAGDDGASSTQDYEGSVVETRNRVDSALAGIQQATSEEDFLRRLDIAGSAIKDAADDFDDLRPPEQFEDESKSLVLHLRELSEALHGTAGQARELGYETLLSGAAGLNFEAWDEVNAVFDKLREQGVDVEPLARH